eukprot:CAMPEP_0115401754 /NCGR_PEP_ID=MMETSP0271-20121206/16054_1 /TAXON_ID=71861 /ORGANISM="Scrippsiella trochoidea, Strain CCMP3099" /LENGTH=49 /DNA_ID= /DNA_START= /DNA_END= /DNA_ORIENTATION=
MSRAKSECRARSARAGHHALGGPTNMKLRRDRLLHMMAKARGAYKVTVG